ncbi:MAG: hypothetical protein GY937_22885 [bacterium]|nr:hypothetical protein [bacterium]
MVRENLEFNIDGDARGFTRAMDQAARASRDLTRILTTLSRDGGERAEKSLDDVGDSMDDMGDAARRSSRQTTTLTGSVTKLALQFNLIDRAINVASRALESMVRVAVDAHRQGIGLNLAFQTMEVRLQGVVGSAQGAKDALSAFRGIAATTAFSVQDVSEAGTTLAAFMGGEFTKNVEGTTKAVADLAAFMGLSATEAAAAMGRAFAGGAGAADILRERGVLNLIKSFKGIDDLTKLTLPQFREAMLDTMVNTTGPIAGATDRMSETTVGAISNMGDAWQNFTTELTAEAMPAIGEFARAVTDVFKLAAEEMTGEEGLSKAIERLAQDIRTHGPEIAKDIKGIADAVAALGTALALIPDFIRVAIDVSSGQQGGSVAEIIGREMALRATESQRTREAAMPARLAALQAQTFPGGFDVGGRPPTPGRVRAQREAERIRFRSAQAAAEAAATVEEQTGRARFLPTMPSQRARGAAMGGITAPRSLLPRTPDLALHGLRQALGPRGLAGGVIPEAGGQARETFGPFARGPAVAGVPLGPGEFDPQGNLLIREQALRAEHEAVKAVVEQSRTFTTQMGAVQGAFRGVAETSDDAAKAQLRMMRAIDVVSQNLGAALGPEVGRAAFSSLEAARIFRTEGATTAQKVGAAGQAAQDVGGTVGGREGEYVAAVGRVAGSTAAGAEAGGAPGAIAAGGIQLGAELIAIFRRGSEAAKKMQTAIEGSFVQIGQRISTLVAQGFESGAITMAVDQMVRDIVIQTGIARLVEVALTEPLKELGEAAKDSDFDGMASAFEDINAAIPDLTRNINTLGDVIEGVNARNKQLVALGGVKGGGVLGGEAATPAGLTVTTISGGFRDVLQQLGNRRDNLLTEIRDELRGMRGGMGLEAGDVAAAPGIGGGANIQVERVEVQQVADMADLDAVIADQFDVGMGRQFARAKRRRGR